MPPVPSMTVREVEAVLRPADYVIDRQRGHRMRCKGERCVPVSRHPGDVPKRTLRSIIEWAGMTIDEFLRLRRGGTTVKRRYSVVLTPEPDGSAFNVTSPDMPGLITFGATREEALAMAQDCAETLILTQLDHGRELPEKGGQAEVATIEVDLDALREELASEKLAVRA